MFDHTVEFIADQTQLAALADRATRATAIALDIETVNWWDRAAERVALVQLAFREAGQVCVAVIDTLARLDLEPLRRPLELSLSTKAIHNASYDATRMLRHYRICTSPIYDTMLAARRSGEKRCSLQAQAETQLGFHLDKTEQRGDWSRRPLDTEQLQYAALDAACTLLLYEQQMARGLRGDYELRERLARQQESFFGEAEAAATHAADVAVALPSIAELNLENTGLALLGIVSELGGRYSPEQLAVSVGSERIGLTGWLIDSVLGTGADIDEATAKTALAALCERSLVRLSLTRRLEATLQGLQVWQAHKAQ